MFSKTRENQNIQEIVRTFRSDDMNVKILPSFNSLPCFSQSSSDRKGSILNETGLQPHPTIYWTIVEVCVFSGTLIPCVCLLFDGWVKWWCFGFWVDSFHVVTCLFGEFGGFRSLDFTVKFIGFRWGISKPMMQAPSSSDSSSSEHLSTREKSFSSSGADVTHSRCNQISQKFLVW